jgi:type I restriction enzyme S subunit
MAGEWRETTLGEVTDFISGGTPSKDNPAYWGGLVPWVSAKDMKQFRLVDTEDHLTEHGVNSGAKLAPAGTTLLLVRGMTLLNDLPICVTRHAVAFNQDVKALRPKPGVRNEFLPYLLLGNKKQLLNLVDLAGHGTGRLNTVELNSLNVVLPSEPEQLAIARILGTLDDKIELNRRMNDTLEVMARTLFKSWFVDFDPVRAKAEGRDVSLPKPLADLFPDSFEDSGADDVPKGWSILGLDEIANFLNGLALQKFPPQGDRFLPVIKIAQLRTENTLGADKASAELAPEYVVNDGDVLFSWSGSLECVLWAGGRGALNQHLFKVTSELYPKWFYFLWIRHHLDDFRGIAAGKATTMGHIQRGHLSAAKVLVPPDKLLKEMSRHFAPLLDKTVQSKLSSKNFAAIRDALLPKLISGELRVPNAERIVAGQV